MENAQLRPENRVGLFTANDLGLQDDILAHPSRRPTTPHYNLATTTQIRNQMKVLRALLLGRTHRRCVVGATVHSPQEDMCHVTL